MPSMHTIHPLRIIEVPARKSVENSDDVDEEHESAGTEESEDLGTMKNVETTKTTKDDEIESKDNDSHENMTLEALARDMNKGIKSGELEDKVANVGGGEDDNGTGNCVESMDLDCESYVDEGGPSNNDMETKERNAKQVSVTKETKRTKNVKVKTTGARKSTYL